MWFEPDCIPTSLRCPEICYTCDHVSNLFGLEGGRLPALQLFKGIPLARIPHVRISIKNLPAHMVS